MIAPSQTVDCMNRNIKNIHRYKRQKNKIKKRDRLIFTITEGLGAFRFFLNIPMTLNRRARSDRQK